MARFKHIETGPSFLPVVLEQQLTHCTFEHALHHLLDNEIGLARLEARYRNDDNGTPAYPPTLLLKVILLGYARGMVSSRALPALHHHLRPHPPFGRCDCTAVRAGAPRDNQATSAARVMPHHPMKANFNSFHSN